MVRAWYKHGINWDVCGIAMGLSMEDLFEYKARGL